MENRENNPEKKVTPLEKIEEVKNNPSMSKVKKGLMIAGLVLAGGVVILTTAVVTAAVTGANSTEDEKKKEEEFYLDPLKDVTSEEDDKEDS